MTMFMRPRNVSKRFHTQQVDPPPEYFVVSEPSLKDLAKQAGNPWVFPEENEDWEPQRKIPEYLFSSKRIGVYPFDSYNPLPFVAPPKVGQDEVDLKYAPTKTERLEAISEIEFEEQQCPKCGETLFFSKFWSVLRWCEGMHMQQYIYCQKTCAKSKEAVLKIIDTDEIRYGIYNVDSYFRFRKSSSSTQVEDQALEILKGLTKSIEEPTIHWTKMIAYKKHKPLWEQSISNIK